MGEPTAFAVCSMTSVLGRFCVILGVIHADGKAICLEQLIATLESAQADPKVYPNEEDQQFIQDALEHATELLERIKAGDEAAIQEFSDLIGKRSGPHV